MKLALVTGGFRRMGAAIAARLAMEGWALALHCRSAKSPEGDLAATLTATGADWHGFYADLADGEGLAALLDEVARHFGRPPDLLVNNASAFEYDDAQTVTPAALAHHHAVNAVAPVILATELARHLGEGDQACVVNILDQRIRHPGGDQLSYTLSKLTLSAATETLARALAPKVRVNAVAPGLTIPTDDYLPAQMVALEAAMPLGRLPEPEDIADAVLWLANAQATTGQTIFVDGGASLKSWDRDFLFLGRDR